MVYAENGDILNAEYVLNSIINESMVDIVNKVSRAGTKLIRIIMDSLRNFIDLLKSTKYDKVIKKLSNDKVDYLKWINLDSPKSSKNFNIIMESFSADGYGKWSSNFQLACSELKSNNELSVDDLKKILYKKDSNINKDNWFKSKDFKNKNLQQFKSDMVSFLKDYTKEINIARKAYSEIKVINGNIINKPIKNEVLQELREYCINYISTYKKICDSIFLLFKDMNYKDSDHKYTEKDLDMIELIHTMSKMYNTIDKKLSKYK